MKIRFTFDSRGGINRWHIDFGDLKRFEDSLQAGSGLLAAIESVTAGEQIPKQL